MRQWAVIAAPPLCGTTHKTVKRVLERLAAGQVEPRVPSPSNTAGVVDLIAQKVQATDGRISAKRLLPLARAAGYVGSARNFRRAVATAKRTWKRERHTYRPWVPVPGEHLVIDWAEEGGRNLFCAVLAWSRYRFVRFGADQTRETTLALLAECFEELNGVPAVVLTDRMGCLKGGRRQWDHLGFWIEFNFVQGFAIVRTRHRPVSTWHIQPVTNPMGSATPVISDHVASLAERPVNGTPRAADHDLNQRYTANHTTA